MKIFEGSEDVIDDLRIGLALYAFALSEHTGEYAGKEMLHDMLRGGLILIARHGELMAMLPQRRQQFGNALIRTGVIYIVGIIIRYEMRTHTQDILLRPLSLGQCAADEVVDAVAHHRRIGTDGMNGIAELLQGVIARVTQIVDGVEQGAVEVEDDYHGLNDRNEIKGRVSDSSESENRPRDSLKE